MLGIGGVDWYRGRSLLAQNRPQEAQAMFDRVYFDLPGELAPKLAFAIATELGQKYALATQMYELVERTDLNYPTAAFGLARCRLDARQSYCGGRGIAAGTADI